MPLTREQFVEQAMAEYESQLVGYATTLLHDFDLARDVVQDTFIRLCQQDPESLAGGLKSWLFTVCRNRAFDVLRKNRRTESLEGVKWRKLAGPGLQPDEHAEYRECMERVGWLLDRLSANQREVIILKFQQGLSYEEISQITGLSSGNVGFLIHTGLKRIRELMPADLKPQPRNHSA